MATEIGRGKWSLGLNNVGALEHVHALQWGRPDYFDRNFHLHRLRTDDVAHHGFTDWKFFRRTKFWVFGKSSDVPVELTADIQEQTRSCGAVMPPFSQRLKQRIAR